MSDDVAWLAQAPPRFGQWQGEAWEAMTSPSRSHATKGGGSQKKAVVVEPSPTVATSSTTRKPDIEARRYARQVRQLATGVPLTSTRWEDANRLDATSAALADAMASMVTSLMQIAEELRAQADQPTSVAQTLEQAGPDGQTTDARHDLPRIVRDSTAAMMQRLKAGFGVLLPLFSSTVRSLNALAVLRQLSERCDSLSSAWGATAAKQPRPPSQPSRLGIHPDRVVEVLSIRSVLPESKSSQHCSSARIASAPRASRAQLPSPMVSEFSRDDATDRDAKATVTVAAAKSSLIDSNVDNAASKLLVLAQPAFLPTVRAWSRSRQRALEQLKQSEADYRRASGSVKSRITQVDLELRAVRKKRNGDCMPTDPTEVKRLDAAERTLDDRIQELHRQLTSLDDRRRLAVAKTVLELADEDDVGRTGERVY